MDDLRWGDLRLFLEAHDAGSFSEAARRLGAEQSTVSRRVAALEEALGSALFLRSRAGLTLTELGEQVLPLAQEARQRITELTEISRRGEVEGRVRLATTEALAVHGLSSALGSLLDAHPGLRIELVTGETSSDLSRREADLALRFARPTHGELVFKRIATLELGLWGHRCWAGTPFCELEWVALDLEGLLDPEGEWVRTHAPRRPRISTNGYLAMLAAIRDGLGAGILPDALAEAQDELVRLESPAPMPEALPLYLTGHRASRHAPRIHLVWDFLSTWASRLAP